MSERQELLATVQQKEVPVEFQKQLFQEMKELEEQLSKEA